MQLYELLPDQWKEVMPNAEEILSSIVIPAPFIPDGKAIFSALELPIAKIKVCIVGQDPYPNSDDAMGLAFSIPSQRKKLPPTLRNIFKELESDVGVKSVSGDLSQWQNSGVLLLNRVLTTEPNISQGHKNIGWERFTEEIVRYLAERPIIFLLWGRSANELASLIPPRQVISGVHPSPLSAYRGFFGSRPFSEANKRLADLGISAIDWQL